MLEEEEQYCKYLSTRGLANSCVINGSWCKNNKECLENIDFSKVKVGDSIYVDLEGLDTFYNLIDSIPNKFVLVTGHNQKKCHHAFFDSQDNIERVLNHSKIIHWYSQYGSISHPKFTRIPIGLDYYTLYKESRTITPNHQEKYYIEEIKKRAPELADRYFKCYGGFQSNLENAINNIPDNLKYFESRQSTRYERFLHQSKYAFVLITENDNHNVWEALCLGCIPIIKTSDIDSLYDGLPVLIVKDWEHITIELLYKTLQEYPSKTYCYEKLTLKYWMDKINWHYP